MRDFKRLQEDPPTGVSAVPTNNNIMLWNAIIFGPSGIVPLDISLTPFTLPDFQSKLHERIALSLSTIQSKVTPVKQLNSPISDTPFEDGTFRLTIEFTEEYPNKPPTVKFVSKMFHPNVYSDGSLCLDILQNRSP